MIRLRVALRCAIDACGANFVVLSLTDLNGFPADLIPKERSRMHRKRQLLWGIIATDKIFRCGGMLSLMSFHLTVLAKPLSIFSVVCPRGIFGLLDHRPWGVLRRLVLRSAG